MPPQTRLAARIADVRKDLERAAKIAKPAAREVAAARALAAEVPDALAVAWASGDLRRVTLPFRSDAGLDVRRAMVALVLAREAGHHALAEALANALRRRGFKVG